MNKRREREKRQKEMERDGGRTAGDGKEKEKDGGETE